MRYFLYSLFTLPLVLYSLYFAAMALGALRKSNNAPVTYPPQKRFAVLIAARNEARVITGLIQSLRAQAYPGNLYDILVIPNNCTDDTEAVAAAAGASILHVYHPVRTKGDVIKQAFDLLQPSGYDAYVILDADNLVNSNFLQRMNDTLCAGYHAAQAKRISKNPNDSWVTGSYTIYFEIINTMINRARMNLNCNAIFYGTGMMISSSLLSRTGYPIQTVTEDIEYAMLCAISGNRIAYVEDAIFYDEQPILFSQSMKQRHRWTAGSYHCYRLYRKALAHEAAKNKNRCAADILLFAFAPFFQVILTCLGTVITAVEFFRFGDYQTTALVGLLSVAAGYIAQIIFAWLILRFHGHSVRKSIMGILLFPLFLLSWFPLNFSCFFANKDVVWEPIIHTRACEINQMNTDTPYDQTL